MLDTLDLTAELSKSRYKPAWDALSLRLGVLQREVRARVIPVALVFEGWQAAGMGTVIGRILGALDPRGYKLHTFGKPGEEALLRPPLWQYWMALPPRGSFAVFDGSWYGQYGRPGRGSLAAWAERTQAFERALTDDGMVLLKFWFHISKDEQAKRLRKLDEHPALSWKVTKNDWRVHDRYAKELKTIGEVLAATNTANAPWTLVPAHDLRYATVCVAETVVAALGTALKAAARGAVRVKRAPAPAPAPARKGVSRATRLARPDPLGAVDLTLEISRDSYEKQLPRLQNRLLELEHRLYPPRIPAVIVYEGWDAAGKGGNIKRLVAGLDHRGFEVIPVGPPEGDERTHHYLWRFWKNLPKAGHITLFDRSWYGRVLVERVEGLARPKEWQRAYQEINEFEAELAAYGVVLVKFWIHISKDEQLRRFRQRERTPYKQWKITPEDWRNRKRWDDYYEAVTDMLDRTSTPIAPWTILEGNQKLYARIRALKTVIAALEDALK